MTLLLERQMAAALEELREVGDETAAALVHACDLAGAVRGGLQDPEIDRFVSGTEQMDEFDRLIDAEKVRHAQQFFATFGLQIGAALVHRSLPESYAAARGAQVLYLTGELVSAPARRVRETTQFFLTLMTPVSPLLDDDVDVALTTLHPGEPGAIAARRIRMFHQCVRRFILERCDERWRSIGHHFEHIDPDGPALGLPLNQEDLLGTLHEFTVAVFDSLGALGVPYNNDDKEAWFHVWNVVGCHMGIGTESAFMPCGRATTIAPPAAPFLPLETKYAGDTLAAIMRRHLADSPEGSILVNALLDELQRPLPRGFKPFPASLMRYLLGRKTADLLGISRGGWVLEALSSLNSMPKVAERVARRRSGALARLTTNELSAIATQRLLQAFIDEGRTGGRPFVVPSHLRNAWGVQTRSVLEQSPAPP
jgi:ER-bound oxygenase mpaB/B'/Rubber oxygenase, catalytic domain